MSTPIREAAAAGTWEELSAAARGCVACGELAASRTQVVPGRALSEARVLLVGEAPGRQEDEAGVPFVGAAGRLLDTLLAEAGLARAQVAVTNVVKCRPPGNRKPTRLETATCTPWLERQLDLLDPAVVCALGGTAAEWALERKSVTIGQVRGAALKRAGRPLVVTYHPAAAIRFGPNGRPRAGLAADLRLVAGLAGEPGAQGDGGPDRRPGRTRTDSERA